MSSVFREGLLKGRHAFLTGGTSGIGLAIAECLAKAGANISLIGRDAAKIKTAVDALRHAGSDARGSVADVRQYEPLAAALAESRQALGEIDILICAAAGNFPAPALGMSANGFKAVVDIDVLGTFNTCRAAYEHLRKPGGFHHQHLGGAGIPGDARSGSCLRGQSWGGHADQNTCPGMGQ